MPALRPQAPRQEILLVLLLLLLLHPRALLLVRSRLEQDAKNVKRQANGVRQHERPQRGERSRRQRVQQDDGQRAQRDPRRLRHEGAEELGRRHADLVEARVLPVVGRDALEEEGAHYAISLANIPLLGLAIRTSDRPHAHGGAQRQLPPVPAAQHLGHEAARAQRARREACPQHRQHQARAGAGEVGQAAAGVVEALALGGDGGDGDGGLDAVGQRDGGDEGAQERRLEGRCVQQRGEERHLCACCAAFEARGREGGKKGRVSTGELEAVVDLRQVCTLPRPGDSRVCGVARRRKLRASRQSVAGSSFKECTAKDL